IAALLFSSSYITDYMTEYRLFHTSIAFFVGNLVYIYHAQLRKFRWVALALSGLVFGVSLTSWFEPLGRGVLPIQIGCVIVAAMTLPQIKWRIPDLSYAIYIWHAPILLALLWPVGMDRTYRWALATSTLTLLASLFSWYLVEKKALAFKDWRPGRATRGR